jgi:hypothetical protein
MIFSVLWADYPKKRECKKAYGIFMMLFSKDHVGMTLMVGRKKRLG